VLVAFITSPLVVLWLYGRSAAGRALLVLVLGLLTMLALSAYWIVPSIFQLLGSLPNGFAPVSSWLWTEGRATISNALWLNTLWGWQYPEYFPFSHAYDAPPLNVLKYCPALLAFGALAFNPRARPTAHDAARFRLTLLAASVALGLIFVSTGTNPPGNIVFERVYSLPLGWLLREPGRFLIAADLMYAVLIALTIDRIVAWFGVVRTQGVHLRPRFDSGRVALRWLVPAALALVVITPGMPLITGAALPDKRPVLPSWHVKMPGYWTEMASYMDTALQQGAVLVLPPDDFYQMPYRWGYYGNDGFIPNLTERRVLIPSAQTYIPTAPQLLSAIDLTSTSILAKDWPVTDRLLRGLGVNLVLVRGDLDTSFPGRSFASPAKLTQALQDAPNFYLLHAAGPLRLYGMVGADYTEYAPASYYATVDDSRPDLRVLTRLPESAALVIGPNRTNTPEVLQVPSVGAWLRGLDRLSWTFVERPGWTYELVQLDSEDPPLAIEGLIGTRAAASRVQVTRSADETGRDVLSISLPVTRPLINGDFLLGVWGPVGDCAAFNPVEAKPNLSATIVGVGGPDGGQFLRLSAQLDSACESKRLQWSGGSLLLDMSVRHGAGADPRICLWEIGADKCATLSQPMAVVGDGWTRYQTTVTPDRGTTALDLFLYADVYEPHTLTRDDYANIKIFEVPSLPQFDVLGTPASGPKPPTLMVHNSSYSSQWQGPAGSDHVVVDGLMNGWILGSDSSTRPQFNADPIRASFGLSIAGVFLALGLALSSIKWRRLYAVTRRVRLGRRRR
jgi:hypothetical protein